MRKSVLFMVMIAASHATAVTYVTGSTAQHFAGVATYTENNGQVLGTLDMFKWSPNTGGTDKIHLNLQGIRSGNSIAFDASDSTGDGGIINGKLASQTLTLALDGNYLVFHASSQNEYQKIVQNILKDKQVADIVARAKAQAIEDNRIAAQRKDEKIVRDQTEALAPLAHNVRLQAQQVHAALDKMNRDADAIPYVRFDELEKNYQYIAHGSQSCIFFFQNLSLNDYVRPLTNLSELLKRSLSTVNQITPQAEKALANYQAVVKKYPRAKNSLTDDEIQRLKSDLDDFNTLSKSAPASIAKYQDDISLWQNRWREIESYKAKYPC